jgi:hypothetical protein
MTGEEIQQFIQLRNQQIKKTSSIYSVLTDSPVFIFIDGKEDTFVANYIAKDKTVIYGYANPIKMLLFLISNKLGIDVFEDLLIKDLEEAINDVLKTYNVNLEEFHGSNIQNKISGDGSSEPK